MEPQQLDLMDKCFVNYPIILRACCCCVVRRRKRIDTAKQNGTNNNNHTNGYSSDETILNIDHIEFSQTTPPTQK